MEPPPPTSPVEKPTSTPEPAPGSIYRVNGPRCDACHKPLFEWRPVSLDEARFRRHLAHSGIPLLVDCRASWCGTCRAMAPQSEAAAREPQPAMRLVKVSTEEAPRLVAELGISSVLFRGGQEVARQAAALPAQRIAAGAPCRVSAVAVAVDQGRPGARVGSFHPHRKVGW